MKTQSNSNSNQITAENANNETLTVRKAEWLTTDNVSRLLQIAPSSLEKARSIGKGPLAQLAYHKIGRSVRYQRSDVE